MSDISDRIHGLLLDVIDRNEKMVIQAKEIIQDLEGKLKDVEAENEELTKRNDTLSDNLRFVDEIIVNEGIEYGLPKSQEERVDPEDVTPQTAARPETD